MYDLPMRPHHARRVLTKMLRYRRERLTEDISEGKRNYLTAECRALERALISLDDGDEVDVVEVAVEQVKVEDRHDGV